MIPVNFSPNWRAVIDTLLGVSGLSYELRKDDEDIVITANPVDAAKIKAKLEETLDTPKAFFEHLPHSIHHESEDKPADAATIVTEKVVAPPLEDFVSQGVKFLRDLFGIVTEKVVAPPLEDSVSQGVKILRDLFGDETFSEMALNLEGLFNEAKGARSDEYVLYSKPAKGGHIAKIWKDFLEALLARLGRVDTVTLRKIWVDKNTHLPETPEDSDSNDMQTFVGVLQQCFGVFENKANKQAILYFNYGMLKRLTFVPEIRLTADGSNQNNEQSIRISKEHLLNYMQGLTQDGTLLRVYKENDATNQLIARPIFWGSKKLISKSHRYTVIIDRSGSMEEHFHQLRDYVLKFIDKLKDFDDKAQIRIVFFNHKTGPYDEFSVTETSAIRRFILNAESSGATRLFGTVEDELKILFNRMVGNDLVAPVLLFTDGRDNASGDRIAALARISQLF